jgi:hypothetical protein
MLRLGLRGRRATADGGTGDGVAITPAQTLLLSRARTGVAGRDGLVAGVGGAAAVEAGSGIVNHPIGTDEGLSPGFGRDETSLKEEGDRLGDEVV